MSLTWIERGTTAVMRSAMLTALVLLLGACAGQPGRPDTARDGKAAGYDPAALARYQQAVAWAQSGDELQAEAAFSALVSQYPDYAGPMVNLAMIRARRQELEPAEALLQQAVSVCTNCAASWNELGLVQRQLGRFADAEQSYLKAMAADAGYANAHFNLAILYELYLQRPELALDQYQRYRQLALAGGDATDVDKWIVDLQRRTTVVERSAQLEPGL